MTGGSRTYGTNRISVRFQYEWHDQDNNWFAPMATSSGSSTTAIQPADHKFLWLQDPRPADAPGLAELGV